VSRPAPLLKDVAVRNGWQSVDEFKECARAWAKKIRVTPARIQVQRMSQKWASCSPGGVVTFSTDLLGENRAFGEAVIVHELIHLKVPNHGPVFRSLLTAYLPTGEVQAVEPEKRKRDNKERSERGRRRLNRSAGSQVSGLEGRP
jgi:predicted metal-dependent hydrolase